MVIEIQGGQQLVKYQYSFFVIPFFKLIEYDPSDVETRIITIIIIIIAYVVFFQAHPL